MLNVRLKTSLKVIAILWICIPKSRARSARPIAGKSVPGTAACEFQFEGKNRDFVKIVCSGTRRSMGVLRQDPERNVAIKLRIPASVINKLAKQLQDSDPTEPPPPPPEEQPQLPADYPDSVDDSSPPQSLDLPDDTTTPPPMPDLISTDDLPEFNLVLKPTDGSQNSDNQIKMPDIGRMQYPKKIKNGPKRSAPKRSAPKRSGPPRYNKNVRIRAKPNGRAKTKLQNKQSQQLSFVLKPKLTQVG